MIFSFSNILLFFVMFSVLRKMFFYRVRYAMCKLFTAAKMTVYKHNFLFVINCRQLRRTPPKLCTVEMGKNINRSMELRFTGYRKTEY